VLEIRQSAWSVASPEAEREVVAFLDCRVVSGIEGVECLRVDATSGRVHEIGVDFLADFGDGEVEAC
jgi:hypothetical protein